MKTFEKSNGEEIIIPNDFELRIEETSNNVYKIDLIDKMGTDVIAVNLSYLFTAIS